MYKLILLVYHITICINGLEVLLRFVNILDEKKSYKLNGSFKFVSINCLEFYHSWSRQLRYGFHFQMGLNLFNDCTLLLISNESLLSQFAPMFNIKLQYKVWKVLAS